MTILGGNAEFFSGTPIKVVKKFREKFGPPISEVLNPPVCIIYVCMVHAYIHRYMHT